MAAYIWGLGKGIPKPPQNCLQKAVRYLQIRYTGILCPLINPPGPQLRIAAVPLLPVEVNRARSQESCPERGGPPVRSKGPRTPLIGDNPTYSSFIFGHLPQP